MFNDGVDNAELYNGIVTPLPVRRLVTPSVHNWLHVFVPVRLYPSSQTVVYVQLAG